MTWVEKNILHIWIFIIVRSFQRGNIRFKYVSAPLTSILCLSKARSPQTAWFPGQNVRKISTHKTADHSQCGGGVGAERPEHTQNNPQFNHTIISTHPSLAFSNIGGCGGGALHHSLNTSIPCVRVYVCVSARVCVCVLYVQGGGVPEIPGQVLKVVFLSPGLPMNLT